MSISLFTHELIISKPHVRGLISVSFHLTILPCGAIKSEKESLQTLFLVQIAESLYLSL